MKRNFLVLAALLACAAAFSQQALPPRSSPVRVAPPPRDGEGGVGAAVPILIYHSIRPYIRSDTKGARRWIATPATLESELSWLRENGYTSVTFNALAAHLDNGAPLPSRPVIISFDDDWQSQYDNAVPLLQEIRLHGNFLHLGEGGGPGPPHDVGRDPRAGCRGHGDRLPHAHASHSPQAQER